MWTSLQRRFNDQNRPSCPRELLVRGLKVVPIDGQANSATWSLGFKETGSCSRTASLSRDFQSLASMVELDTMCYLVAFVGDLHRTPGIADYASSAQEDPAKWVLVSFVPESCTAAMAKRMADNRNGLKAGLGAEYFCGDMWCSSREQITLSHYIKTLEANPGGMDADTAEKAAAIQAAYRGKQSRKNVAELKANRESAALAIQRQRRRKSGTFETGGGGAEGLELSDATAEVWEERIKGVKSAYVDSCVRLSSALEELEQTLCLLTGDEYRADEPMLHSRAHLLKKLQIINSTGQLL